MSVATVGLLLLIVLALALVATGALNLYASNPRYRGIQLATLVVVLVVIVAAYEGAGALWASLILVLAIAVEAVHIVLKKRRAT
jgi:hypothetical protein